MFKGNIPTGFIDLAYLTGNQPLEYFIPAAAAF
jgi:hypothetical protein